AERYEAVHLATSVQDVDTSGFDRILVAVGRRPNGALLGADAAGVAVDERGFIAVDEQLRTNVPHIHAIGDVVGEPMLAHKASHEGKVAAEAIAGHDVSFDVRAIPSVAYTDPEVAWMGLTETEAREQGVAYEKASFPWAASGRALTMGRSDGLTKLLVDPETRRILAAGMVGINAGELIAETVHAIGLGRAGPRDHARRLHAVERQARPAAQRLGQPAAGEVRLPPLGADEVRPRQPRAAAHGAAVQGGADLASLSHADRRRRRQA